MLDIDHFKKINDVHGHLAGDYVLKEVARHLQQRIRRDEVLARYGGEEFAIILPETNLEGGRALAEGLREKVEQSRFTFQGEVIRVTISIGGAMLNDDDKTGPDLIRRADEKLYDAKRAGLATALHRRRPPWRLAGRTSRPRCASVLRGPRVSASSRARLPGAVESPAVDARREAREAEGGHPLGSIVLASGRGCNVTDADGNRLVDLAAGFGALLLGHGAEETHAALARQSASLWLALGDVYGSEPKLALCERLAALYPRPGARVMLGASGADAVTAALKTAALATGRPGVVAFHGAYHGLSHGPLAACGLRPSFRAPFAEQLNQHVTFLPYPGDEAALAKARSDLHDVLVGGTVGCVLVEPILGRGGCVVPPGGFLPSLRAACDARGALPRRGREIWTGLGRSGAWLASVASGVTPDVVCLGKGLGGGLPVSACVGSAEAMAPWGAHGGTTIHHRDALSGRRSGARLPSRRSRPSSDGASSLAPPRSARGGNRSSARRRRAWG